MSEHLATLVRDARSGLRLDGQVSLVTGGAGDIGRAIAAALVGAGSTVVVADIVPDQLEASCRELQALDIPTNNTVFDVTDEAAVDQAIGNILSDYGRLDIVVNNAGIGARENSELLAHERWSRVVEVNLTGTFLCSRLAARAMTGTAGGGTIVNIASIMGLLGNQLYPNAAYHASKGAVINLTRALAVEWASRGIRVNTVAPTFVHTSLTQSLLEEEGIYDGIMARTPMRRLATPSDVAWSTLFFASDGAAMVTGAMLPVDGGWTAA